MAYADTMRKALIRRSGDWLAIRSWPRLTVFCAFLLAMVVAWHASSGLLHLGVRNMAARFSLCFLAGYATYLAIVGLWFYVKPTIDADRLLRETPDEITTIHPLDDETDWEGILEESARHQNQKGNSFVGLLIFGAIVGSLFAMFWFTRHARWYLSEVYVDGGKVRHRALPQAEMHGWLAAALLQTAGIAIVLVVHYAVIGAILQWMLPNAVTLADVRGKL